MPLFYCLGLGVWLGITYDLLTAFHRDRACRAQQRFLHDILLSASGGTALFLLALAITGGEIRPMMVAAVIGGAVTAHRCVGRWIRVAFIASAGKIRSIDRCWRQISARILKKMQISLKKALVFSKKGLQSAFYMLYNKKRP